MRYVQVALFCLLLLPLIAQAEWKPVEGHIMTRWAKEVDPAKVLPEHPRPQLQRESWINLNGLWDFGIATKSGAYFIPVLNTSERTPQAWRMTVTKPQAGWEKPGFDDSSWKDAQGGFGTEGTPNARIGTKWDGSDIWLRKSFTVDKVPDGKLSLRVHHDEDAEVYLNGTKVFSGKEYLTDYENRTLDPKSLKQGENTVAVHCKQTRGGQYIDAGIVVLQERKADGPAAYDRKILVPFPVESALSGVKQMVTPNDLLYYKRTFTVPPSMKGQRILLHFGAVDWESDVYVNGHHVGRHRGGYDPFSYDVTAFLKQQGEQTVSLKVWDPTNKGFQPRGKQVSQPRGIWYTSVSGIWRTVWLEAVSPTHIDRLNMVSDIRTGALKLTVQTKGDAFGVKVKAEGGGASVSGAPGKELVLKVENPVLWSPDNPKLYDLKVTLEKDGKAVDEVTSYFGLRETALNKDADGINRLFLNGKPLFQIGPLDQGWWPDGLYTAPTDEALRYDVEMTKKVGYNMIRKHVKVEPNRWYYHCDQLGIVVWQDMPNGDGHIGGKSPDLERDRESADNYYQEWGRIIDNLGNHPCIVMWVPFNEGWGQFATAEVTAWTKERDPTRLVNQASGWTDRNGGDVHDIHSYPGPATRPTEPHRAIVLGEFGGLGLPVEGHLWWDKRNWGYRTYEATEELRNNYDQLMEKLGPLIKPGLAAAVYTQTTDCEGEVNGLMTYDREVLKFDAARLKEQHDKLISILK